MNIRPMRPGDIPRVIEIAAAVDHVPAWPPEVYERALDPDATPARIALVAEHAAAGVAGFLVGVLIPSSAELEVIAVARQVQRQGIGRRLVAELMVRLRAHRITGLMLEVRESNQAARRLYASLDFKETGRRRAYYSDPREDAILLERSVDENS